MVTIHTAKVTSRPEAMQVMEGFLFNGSRSDSHILHSKDLVLLGLHLVLLGRHGWKVVLAPQLGEVLGDVIAVSHRDGRKGGLENLRQGSPNMPVGAGDDFDRAYGISVRVERDE